MFFRDRADAGRQLAARLAALDRANLVVLGLPRGGVVVASEVAAALAAPLDVIIVRKLGVPQQPELAMGAIGEGGVRVIDARLITAAGVSAGAIRRVEEMERAELERRARTFRAGRPPLSLQGATALIVDDGIATGSTAQAAAEVVRHQGAEQVIVAAPVGSPEAVRRLSTTVDQVIVLTAPAQFFAIGEFYADFSPTQESEVVALLDRARRGIPGETDDLSDQSDKGATREEHIRSKSEAAGGESPL
ncbi:MAG: phosphoribosyltransferase family protein [Acidimicrobiia bacterium]|nr:phosphoribosyltransferase family protein [Acidimicrobiia bacterium]